MQRFDIEQGEVLLSIQYTLALEAQRAEPPSARRPWTPPSWRPEDLAQVVSIAAQQGLEAQLESARRARVPAGSPAPAPAPARPVAARHPSALRPSVMAPPRTRSSAVAAGARAPGAAARSGSTTPSGAWVRDVVTKSFSGPPGRPGPGPARSRPAPAPSPSELGLLDPATGAGSNRALRRDLAQAFAAPSPAAGVHLVALQVEPLPDIRRREGDAAAERLLRTAVETVSPLLRARDRIYRTGPNQLALLLRSVGEDGVEAALARLARQVPGLLAERGVSGVRIVLRRVHVRHSELPGAPAPGTVTR